MYVAHVTLSLPLDEHHERNNNKQYMASEDYSLIHISVDDGSSSIKTL